MTDNRKVIDARNMACPGPITVLAKAYRDSKIGDVFELWATDQGVKSDTTAWAKKTGNQIDSISEDRGWVVITIRILKR